MRYRNKLTEMEKWMIRRDFHNGVQQKALAISYGVSASTISLVCNPDSYERKLSYQKERYAKTKEVAHEND